VQDTFHMQIPCWRWSRLRACGGLWMVVGRYHALPDLAQAIALGSDTRFALWKMPNGDPCVTHGGAIPLGTNSAFLGAPRRMPGPRLREPADRASLRSVLAKPRRLARATPVPQTASQRRYPCCALCSESATRANMARPGRVWFVDI